MRSSNTMWQPSTVSRAGRENLHGHKGTVVWLTGLSGSGKSTLAHAVEEYLHKNGCRTFVLDGDNVRHGLCADLGFSDADRSENIRRVGETAKLFLEAGTIVLAAFISPFERDRSLVKELFSPGDFFEIYCTCSLDVCEQRDVKGLYKKARTGEIENFTGISSPYQAPLQPALSISTDLISINDSIKIVIDFLYNEKIINFR
jgi:adenylylsulfate kinase